MGKKLLKSRKRREQTIAIIAVAAVVLILTAVLLIWGASNNENLGEHDHEHAHGSENTEDVELTLKLAVDAHAGTVHYKSAEKFAEQIEKKTGGAIDVKVYPVNEIGSIDTIVKSMQEDQGVVDIVITSVMNFTDVEARMDMSTHPFMFNSESQAWAFLNGDIQAEIESAMIPKNIRVLTHYAGTATCIGTKKKQLNNVTDMMNLNLAISAGSRVSRSVQLMNANTVTLDTKTLLQTLKTSKCDGYMGSLSYIYAEHLYKDFEYLAVSYHEYEGLAFAITESTWKKLGKYQDSMEEVAKSSAYSNRELIKQQDKKLEDTIKASGVRVMIPDMSSFTKKAESALRAYSSKYGSLLERYLMERGQK